MRFAAELLDVNTDLRSLSTTLQEVQALLKARINMACPWLVLLAIHYMEGFLQGMV
jgi:hypothetical protein